MDFKRIQIIFLITFVVIDVFLFSLFYRNQHVQTDNVNGGNTASVFAEMKSDHVHFEQHPSKSRRIGYYISGRQDSALDKKANDLKHQTNHTSGHSLSGEFKHPYHLNVKHPQKTIQQILRQKDLIFNGQQYHYVRAFSNKRRLVCAQKIQPLNIHHVMFSKNSEISFRVHNHKITGYTQGYLHSLKNLRERSKTISAQKALILLYQYNKIPNGTKITCAHFAYTKLLAVQGTYVYIPTWVIGIKEKDSTHSTYCYVNAFNGSIISHNSSQQQKLKDATE